MQKFPLCFLSSFSLFYTNVFFFGSLPPASKLFFLSPIPYLLNGKCFLPLSTCLEIVFTLHDSTGTLLSQKNKTKTKTKKTKLKFSFIFCVPIAILVYTCIVEFITHYMEWHHQRSDSVRLASGISNAFSYGAMSNALVRTASRWHRLFWELVTCHGK